VITTEAGQRFAAAEGRDLAAGARDVASAARDVAATARDELTAEHAADDHAQAEQDRRGAADDRKAAADDREQLLIALSEADMDDLTGTYRRVMGAIALRAEIDRAHRADGRLVLAFVDVDDLKARNDAGGHAAGDALLLDVVECMRSGIRSYDPIVRLGGDEFVCALTDADLDDARGRFAEIAAALARRNGGASISVGFAKLAAGDDLDDLMQRGDAALYEAKRNR
jgi:diguanylate cyclase (GGDEF)-like protein